MAFTNNAAEKVLQGFTGYSVSPILTSCYIALGTITNGEFVETTYTGYRREVIGQNSPATGTITSKIKVTNNTATNSNETIFFQENTGSEVTVNAFALCSGSTGNNIQIYGELTLPSGETSITIGNGNVPLFRTNQFNLTLS